MSRLDNLIIGDLSRRLRAVEIERDALLDEVSELRATLSPPPCFPADWGLTFGETKLLSALCAAHPHPLSRARAMIALYGERPEEPGTKVIDVYFSKIRHKLRAAGVPGRIACRPGFGWSYTEPAALGAALAAHTPAPIGAPA